jgi:hypothetical protein
MSNTRNGVRPADHGPEIRICNIRQQVQVEYNSPAGQDARTIASNCSELLLFVPRLEATKSP